MPVRAMAYDAAEYERQARAARRPVRREKGITRAESFHPASPLCSILGKNGMEAKACMSCWILRTVADTYYSYYTMEWMNRE